MELHDKRVLMTGGGGFLGRVVIHLAGAVAGLLFVNVVRVAACVAFVRRRGAQEAPVPGSPVVAARSQ